MSPQIMLIFGTRPDAIKMAPVINALKNSKVLTPVVVVTGQHQEMLNIMLEIFQIEPDYRLDIMEKNQTLTQLCVRALSSLSPLVEKIKPQWVLVQGDTTTAFAGAMAAFYHKIPVMHLEAGLRSFDLYNPWPEEANRKLVAALAQIHCAPTEHAAAVLRKENIPEEQIKCTGNTIVDALHYMTKKLSNSKKLQLALERQYSYLDASKKLIIVTCHRRESFGYDLQEICRAILSLSYEPEVEIIFPIHLNPQVQEPVKALLRDKPNIHLLPPLDYMSFVYLLQRCYFVMTDSGGIQEEACTLDKPTLVLRNKTERVESIEVGNSILVGTQQDKILAHAKNLLCDSSLYKKMSHTKNPYGDGHSSDRIVELLVSLTR